MTVAELRAARLAGPDQPLHLMLPDGDFVPAHFHITEVGRVQKDFIDCGGTARSAVTCRLQVWVAHDTEHRLVARKLADILKLAAPLLKTDDLAVEVEYERDAVSQFPIAAAEVTPMGCCSTSVASTPIVSRRTSAGSPGARRPRAGRRAAEPVGTQAAERAAIRLVSGATRQARV